MARLLDPIGWLAALWVATFGAGMVSCLAWDWALGTAPPLWVDCVASATYATLWAVGAGVIELRKSYRNHARIER